MVDLHYCRMLLQYVLLRPRGSCLHVSRRLSLMLSSMCFPVLGCLVRLGSMYLMICNLPLGGSWMKHMLMITKWWKWPPTEFVSNHMLGLVNRKGSYVHSTFMWAFCLTFFPNCRACGCKLVIMHLSFHLIWPVSRDQLDCFSSHSRASVAS